MRPAPAPNPADLFRLGPVWAARAEAAWLRGDDAAARADGADRAGRRTRRGGPVASRAPAPLATPVRRPTSQHARRRTR